MAYGGFIRATPPEPQTAPETEPATLVQVVEELLLADAMTAGKMLGDIGSRLDVAVEPFREVCPRCKVRVTPSHLDAAPYFCDYNELVSGERPAPKEDGSWDAATRKDAVTATSVVDGKRPSARPPAVAADHGAVASGEREEGRREGYREARDIVNRYAATFKDPLLESVVRGAANFLRLSEPKP